MATEIPVEEFVATVLDKTNPRFESLVDLLVATNGFRFFKKEGDFPQLVQELAHQDLWPVVDKKFNLAIGSFAHGNIRAELWRYHKRIPNLARWSGLREIRDAHAASYTNEGMGYHFTSASSWQKLTYGRVEPFVSESYQPDKYDKDLFIYCRQPDFFF